MKHSRMIPKALLSLLLVTILPNAQAKSLLIDFGPTAVASTEATLSMAHFAGAVPSTEISWNSLVADSTSLVYSDGSAAVGVSIDLGRSAAGVATIDFSNNGFSSGALGGQIAGGIYTNTSPIKDGIFGGSGGGNTLAVGLRVNGLAAGTYTVYVSARNTSTAFNSAQRIFSAAGPSSTTFPFSTSANTWTDEANSGTTVGLSPGADGWPYAEAFAYGDNCAQLVVNVEAGNSLYLAALGVSNELRGFLNSVEIVPGSPVLTKFPALVLRQPTASQTVYEGSTVTISNPRYAGVPPLFYQWSLNGALLSGATNATLTSAASVTGNYSVQVSNAYGQSVSSNGLVTVIPLKNTGQMTNIWNLLPGDRPYVTVTNNTSGERGLAYNPATGNLLLVSQVPSNNLVVLDSKTGAQKYFMNLSGISAGAAGINMIGVADDGVVYAVNVTANSGSASTPFKLLQWANDNAETAGTELLSGDPGWGTSAAGLRWGDSLAVRGAGADTQILMAPGSGTNVILFMTYDGASFFPVVINVAGVSSGFAQFGVAFGTNNTFWAKSYNQSLYLVQFDTSSGTGTVLNTYSSTNGVPNAMRLISTDSNHHWLAGIMSVGSGLADNVQLYDVSNLTNGPALVDQELFTTLNANTFMGTGTGSTAFGGNYLFALDSQNGIKAFLIDPNYSPSLDAFSITARASQTGASLVLTWPSVSTHTYQVQSKTALSDAWSDLGAAVTATSSSASFTNAISGPARFYRVRGQ